MPYRFASSVITVLAAFAIGCGSSHGPATDGGAQSPLLEITVEPADQELVIDGPEPAQSHYIATGRFEDGHTEDISNRVAFSLADATLGSFLGPDFKSGLTHGGRTRVVAQAEGVTGETALTLRIRQRYTDPSATNLPQDPTAPFTNGPVDASRAPNVVYPNDG